MLTVANIKEAKVVMLGSSTVGKSTIIKWLVSQKYQNNTTPTIGTSLITKTFDIDGLCIKLQIWDTGGSERYRSIAPMYFRDADAAIIVYDVTQKSSFEDVGSWLKELREYGPSSIIIGLAGNKQIYKIEVFQQLKDVRFAKVVARCHALRGTCNHFYLRTTHVTY